MCSLLSCFDTVPNHAGDAHPLWFLRLTHTRLTDAILDLCGVPTKEQPRRACYHILTCCSAPPPCLFHDLDLSEKHRTKNNPYCKSTTPSRVLEELLEKAIDEHGVPKAAASRLRVFLYAGCSPMPLDLSAAIDALEGATKKLRSMDDPRQHTTRRNKRYEDVARGLRAMRNLNSAMMDLDIIPTRHEQDAEARFQSPAYVSLDLGMRQRLKHYHGHVFFQAILLPEDLESIMSNDALLAGGGRGIKVAEGGRYDELVSLNLHFHSVEGSCPTTIRSSICTRTSSVPCI